jgi:hypothetical protein
MRVHRGVMMAAANPTPRQPVLQRPFGRCSETVGEKCGLGVGKVTRYLVSRGIEDRHAMLSKQFHGCTPKSIVFEMEKGTP